MKAHDPSDSVILDTRFPGYAWMPRWTRKYWTPPTALACTVFVFSSGVWWGTWKTAPDVKDLHEGITAIQKTMDEQVLKKSDIRVLTFQVEQMWSWYNKANTEYNTPLQPIAPPSPAVLAPQPPKKPR